MTGAAINMACAFVNLVIWAATDSLFALAMAGFSMAAALIFAIADGAR